MINNGELVNCGPGEKERTLTAAGVLDELEQELLATLSEFDDEAVGLAVLDAVERVRTRALAVEYGV